MGGWVGAGYICSILGILATSNPTRCTLPLLRYTPQPPLSTPGSSGGWDLLHHAQCRGAPRSRRTPPGWCGGGGGHRGRGAGSRGCVPLGALHLPHQLQPLQARPGAGADLSMLPVLRRPHRECPPLPFRVPILQCCPAHTTPPPLPQQLHLPPSLAGPIRHHCHSCLPLSMLPIQSLHPHRHLGLPLPPPPTVL